MPHDTPAPIDRLTRFPPFDSLPFAERSLLADELSIETFEAGEVIAEEGAPLAGLYILESGTVDIVTSDGDLITHRHPGDPVGERGLLRDGNAVLTARASEPCTLIMMPAERFRHLVDSDPDLGRWYGRGLPATGSAEEGGLATGLTALQVADLMVRNPVTCPENATVTEVARIMRDRGISSVLVQGQDRLAGIVTVHDMTNKVLAEGKSGEGPVSEVMSRNLRTLLPSAVGLDALIEMSEHGINHMPVVTRHGDLIGMIGKTDLFRRQAATASHMVAELVAADSAAAMAEIMERLPQLLSQLVTAGARPNAITRRVTDLTDAITRRLLSLAEETFGPPPVPYLWAACGSQGRREQTGVSDQDNCLILSDEATPAHDAYFAKLAQFVSDGLDETGFIYCPGDMMATNPRWRQPRRVWRDYFAKWIAEPDTEAQMLASVMFDLRPIAGTTALFDDLQSETLSMARANSIFVSHMVGNSLKHAPPLGLFRGLATIRSGEHKNTLDLKMAGVVPIIDLARVYALSGAIEAVNTRDRLVAAGEDGVISASGARDLIDAYDLIAETRLRHQAEQIRSDEKPDNFLDPSRLSELERNHLRDAFMMVKTMQSALGQGRIGMG